MQLSRRNFLIGAPAVVAAASIMPVSAKQIMHCVSDYTGEPVGGIDILYGALNINPENLLTLDDLSPSRSNQLLTIDMITRETVQLFVNSNEFIKQINREWEEEFAVSGAKIGSELRIKLPTDYSVAEDVAMYGTGFIKEGKRIDPRDVYESPGVYPRSCLEGTGLRYNKELRTIEQVVNDGLAKAALPVAAAVGIAKVVEKNPVVSRRFWK